MANVERRLVGRTWGVGYQVISPVRGKTKIEKGDLLFLNRVVSLLDRGTSTADYFLYPFSKLSGSTLSLSSNITLARENFIGVAAWHSTSGVTEDLAIWIHGRFKFDLKNSRFVKPLFSVIPAGSGVTLYNQKVAVDSASSEILGVATEYRQFSSSVRMQLVTMFSPQFTQVMWQK